MKENKISLLPEEWEKIHKLIEDYQKIYKNASRIGKEIEDLQTEMVKVSADMTNKSTEESNLFKNIAARLNLDIEEARKIILNDINQIMQNENKN